MRRCISVTPQGGRIEVVFESDSRAELLDDALGYEARDELTKHGYNGYAIESDLIVPVASDGQPIADRPVSSPVVPTGFRRIFYFTPINFL